MSALGFRWAASITIVTFLFISLSASIEANELVINLPDKEDLPDVELRDMPDIPDVPDVPEVDVDIKHSEIVQSRMLVQEQDREIDLPDKEDIPDVHLPNVVDVESEFAPLQTLGLEIDLPDKDDLPDVDLPDVDVKSAGEIISHDDFTEYFFFGTHDKPPGSSPPTLPDLDGDGQLPTGLPDNIVPRFRIPSTPNLDDLELPDVLFPPSRPSGVFRIPQIPSERRLHASLRGGRSKGSHESHEYAGEQILPSAPIDILA
eukprot:GDKH01026927.1.p1 GENE.GDKH01026927.1~~GDKH01026927.1.p1  ORF type:complete len:260 (+),score=34.89 GDKH01026927.1:108-887(+)